jgi:hypothetical protein
MTNHTGSTVTIDLAEYLDLERTIYAETQDPRLATAYAMSAYPTHQHAELVTLLATQPSTGAFAESSMEIPPSESPLEWAFDADADGKDQPR